jgi:nitroimidazol reductase NimA-like FMN-containing flavoprotein (pyridoxamine 5'-phosphate oxidase superfamily)
MCVCYKYSHAVCANIRSVCLEMLKQLVDAVASMVQSTSYKSCGLFGQYGIVPYGHMQWSQLSLG